MENQNSTELQSIGNSFRDLQQKIWSLKLDIAQLERELYETEFRKAIQEKKQALQILEDLENEKKTNIVNSMLQNGLKSVKNKRRRNDPARVQKRKSRNRYW